MTTRQSLNGQGVMLSIPLTAAGDGGRLVTETDPLPIVTDLEISKGNVDGHSPEHKFGHSPSGIQTTRTDIWPRADATPTQQIWLAPTAARIHTISSDNAGDDIGGIGATTIEVTYLADWNTPEAMEVVAGDIDAGIAMTNAAVMINRMEIVSQATSTSTNTGTIIATAATDTTITAVIMPGKGQTQQAIYGVPSGYTFFMNEYAASINDNTGGSRVEIELLANTTPDVNPIIFIHKHSFEIQNYGASRIGKAFNPPRKFTGPCILKVAGKANANDTICSAGFDGVLVQDGF
jgi:hypothetical protein